MLSRATFRTLRLSSQSSLAPARTLRQASRRSLTTAPPHLRSRSWKNSALRWGIAGAGIYFYNTSPVFAEAPENNLLNPHVDALHDETSSETLDTLTASSRNKRAAQPSALQNTLSSASESQIALTDKPSSSSSSSSPSPSPQRDSHLNSATLTPDESSTPGGAAELEEEAANEGAFNEETGEINWDCPCLGGMAYGPCGEEFRAAFSCFVYSKEDPKGMECIDKFQGMQDCFRAHPEHYKAELEDVDDEETRKGLEEERMKIEGEVENRRKDLKERGLLQEGDAGTEIPKTTAQGSDKAVQSGKAPNLESGNAKPAPAQSSPTSTSTSSEPQSISEQAHSSTISPGTPAKTTSHTPQEYTQDKELEHGASSQTIRQPKAPKVDKEARPETEELVPKAAHDATTTNTIDTHSKAKSA